MSLNIIVVKSVYITIILMSKGFKELRESSLEDVYHYLCKNEPSKKSKKHEEWDYL